MGRLLDEDTVIKVLERWQKAFRENSHHVSASDLSLVVKDVRELPPTQPETAKRIVGKSRDGMPLWYQCDMCDEPVDEQDNYCRGCGRRLIDG